MHLPRLLQRVVGALHRTSVVVAAAVSVASVADGQPPGASLWNATLTIAPAPSPFLSDWARNPTIAQLSIFYSGTTSESYRVEAIITERRRGELGRGISGVKDIAFGPASAQLTTQDLVDWAAFNYDPSLRSQIVRTGLLPEGDYQICARIRNQFGGALLTQACSDFRIQYPESPQLIAPSTGSGVSVAQPTFQWVPVQAPAEAGVRYRVRIAKRLPGQAPAIALQANVPQHEGESGGAAFYVYPLDALPLDTGATYVWQVQTLTRDGVPFSAGGRPSEIWSFAWGPGGVGGPRRVADRPFTDTLTLVPGLARLRGLSLVNATESDFDVRLDGAAVLEVSPPGETPFSVPVEVRGLTVDRVAGVVTGVSAGRVVGRLTGDRGPATRGLPLVRFTSVEWAPGTGVSFGGAIDAAGTVAPMTGRVALTPGGYDGVLVADAPSGRPLLRVGQGAATLAVETVRAAWPAATLRLDGRPLLFDQPAGCMPVSLTLTGNEATTTPILISCDGSAQLPLVAGATRPVVQVRAARFTLAVDPRRVSAEVVGDASATLLFDEPPPAASATNVATCGVTLRFVFAGDSAVAGDTESSCEADDPVRVGWLTVQFRRVRLTRLAWRRATGFDLAGVADLQLGWRAFPGVSLPYLTDVPLRPEGLDLPSVASDVAARPFDVAGFRASLSRLALAGATWRWADYAAGRTDAVRFTAAGRLAFGSQAPSCLRGPMEFTGAPLGGGRFRVPVDMSLTGPCPVPAGPVTLDVTRIGGALDVAVRDSGVAADTLPGVGGAVRWPAAWQCRAEASVSPLNGLLPMRGDAQPEGSAAVSDGACAVPARPYPLQLSERQIRWTASGDGMAVSLRGRAAALGAGGNVVPGQGTLDIDVATARIIDGSVTLAGPLPFGLPLGAPSLRFEVSGLTLSREGLDIDGRHALVLDGPARIGATFVGVRVDTAGRIRRGAVRFDTTFAFAAAAQSAPVAWRVVAAGSAVAGTGLRFDWPANVALDSAGLRASGTSRGAIRVDDVRIPDAAFVAERALAIDPATGVVREGRGEWRVAGSPIAVLDDAGLRLEGPAVARAALPERLALPSLNGAWLETRRGDSLIVSPELLPSGVRVRTAAGQSAWLVLPALAAVGAVAPRVPVTVDLTFDGLYERLASGRVAAASPATLSERLDPTAVGLPLTADSLSLAVANGIGVLRVHGRPVLFGAPRGAAGAAILAIGGDGAATLELAASLDARLALVPQGSGAWYLADSVHGRAARREGRSTTELDVIGRLELGNVGAARWRAPLAVRLTEQGMTPGEMGTPDAAGAQLDAGGVRVRLARVAVPRFSWTPAGFDFEFQLDGPLDVAAVGAVTPEVRGLSLVPAGLAVPEVLVPELDGPPVMLDGWKVRARALRVRRGVLPIFGGTASATVSVDLTLGFGRLPDGAPPELAALSVSALDVAVRDGRLVGTIEPRELSPAFAVALPNDAALRIRRLSGALAAVDGATRITLEAGGTLRLPPAQRCAAGDSLVLSGGSWRLDASARPFGQATAGAMPCPVLLGGLRARVGSGVVRFDTLPSGASVASLEGLASVAIASGAADSARGSGTLRIDLLRGTVLAGQVRITDPFRVGVPSATPALTFLARQAVIDSAGLVLRGDGEVVMADGLAAPVQFESLALDPADGRIRAGRATFGEGLGLEAALTSGGGLRWRAVPSALVTGSAMAAEGVRLRLAAPATLTSEGFRVEAVVPAAVRLGEDRLDVTATPGTGLARVGIDPPSVSEGRLLLRREGTEVGVLDARGFLPGAAFAARTLPTMLALGDSAAGYLELREALGSRVRAEPSDTALHVFTTPGATVTLVLPGLAAAGVAPRVQASLDLWLDPRTLAPRSGRVVADAGDAGPPLLVRRAAGAAEVHVRRIAFARGTSDFALLADTRLVLPAAFGGAVVRLDSVPLSSAGFATSQERGRVAEAYDSSVAPLVTAPLGTGAALELLGVRWAPATGSGPTLTVAAALTSPLFTGSSREGLYFTAVLDAGGVRTVLDQPALEARRLAIGRFTFQPTAFGGVAAVTATASDERLELTLRGALRLGPEGSVGSVAVQDIRLGTAGLALPATESDAGPLPQDVRLFGGTMTVRRTGAARALQLALANGTLTVTLAGSLPVLGRSVEVSGLAIGSDGSVALASAPGFVLIPALGGGGGAGQGPSADPVAAVQTISADNGQLALAGRVVLPAPFRAQQGDGGDFSLRLGLDGVPNATRITVWNQAEGCCDRAGRAMLPLGPMALVHARRLDLSLDLLDIRRSAVSLVGDAYIGSTDQSRAANRIAFGSVNGSIVRPGLSVGFDGSVTLGNVTLLREFTVGFQALNLTVKSVAVPNTVTLSSAGAQGDGSPFAFVVSGGLALNVSQVSGTIAFQDVSIGTSGVRFAPTSLQAATLRIAGVLALELNDLTIITRDTTVSVEPSDPSGSTRELRVRNLVSFGGRLTLEGSGLSGGVERFLFYQTTDGETALLIKNASLSIPNTLEFRADFEFSQRPDGFSMSLGAQGTLLQKVSVGMYGVISKSDSDGLRLGMFLRGTVQIPLLPGVLTVEELGGGIFYRPREQDINGAWTAAQLDPSLRQIGGNVPVNPAAGNGLLFAVMLYGKISVAQGVATGRTLITVTDQYFEILGEVTLLNRGNDLAGTVRLKLGIREAFAEGDIRIRVNLAGMVTGNAQLAFFVYGPETWGVLGSMNVRVLNFLNASGRLFVGPPGFLIRLDVRAGFNVSVVKVNTTFQAAVWYVRANRELGGFGVLAVRAEVFDGLATITATLRGAFLFRSGYSLLYASASVKVETFLGDFEGSVWVKVENGDVDGGLGRDKTMDRLVARAAQVEQQMTQAAASATTAITQARNVAATVRVSAEELSAAFLKFQERNEFYRGFFFGGASAGEERTDPATAPEAWRAARQAYGTALSGRLAFEERVFLGAVQRPALDSLSASLEATRQLVVNRLRRVATRVNELADAPLPAEPEDPLSSGGPDSLSMSQSVGQDGRTTRQVVEMPTFSVDAGKAQAAVQRTAAWMEVGRVSAAQLRVAIDSMEKSLREVRVLIEDRSDDSFLRFAERYHGAREEMERYVVTAIATMRLEGRTADSSAVAVRRLAPQLREHVLAKTQALANNHDGLTRTLYLRAGLLRQLGVAIDLDALARRFAQPDASLMPALRGNVDSLGLAVWVRLGAENAPAWADTMRARLAALEQGSAVSELEALRRGHAELSAAAEELFDAQANLYVALRDAYGAYVRSFFSDPAAETFQSLPMPTDEFRGLLQRRNDLRRLVQQPLIYWPRMEAATQNRMLHGQTRVDFHPWVGPMDAHFAGEGPAGSQPTLYLVGRRTTAWFYIGLPSASSTETRQARTLRVAWRGFAGYSMERSANYDAVFMQARTSSGSGWDIGPGRHVSDQRPPGPPRFLPDSGFAFTAPRGPFAGQRLLYVPSLDPLVVRWEADSPAGVANWFVGVGTQPDSANLAPIRDFVGRRSFSFGGLRAAAGRPVYVIGRATSGEGVEGPQGASLGIVRDTVAPRLRALPRVEVPAFSAVAPQPDQVLTACATGRPTAQARWFEPVRAPELPVGVMTPTEEPSGGISARWEWRVDTSTVSSGTATDWTEITVDRRGRFTIPSRRFDFRRPWFVHVRSRNPSGVPSNVVVSAAVSLGRDPTGPTPPQFCQLRTEGGGLVLTAGAASADPESEVVGYQFAVHRGTATLKAFPAGAEPEIPATAWRAAESVRLSVNGTPWVLPAADLDSAPVRVTVRAVNASQRRSAVSGAEVATTRLPPPTPIIRSVAREQVSIFERFTIVLSSTHAPGVTATPRFEASLEPEGAAPRWAASDTTIRTPNKLILPVRYELRVRVRAGNGLVSPEAAMVIPR